MPFHMSFQMSFRVFFESFRVFVTQLLPSIPIELWEIEPWNLHTKYSWASFRVFVTQLLPSIPIELWEIEPWNLQSTLERLFVSFHMSFQMSFRVFFASFRVFVTQLLPSIPVELWEIEPWHLQSTLERLFVSFHMAFQMSFSRLFVSPRVFSKRQLGFSLVSRKQLHVPGLFMPFHMSFRVFSSLFVSFHILVWPVSLGNIPFYFAQHVRESENSIPIINSLPQKREEKKGVRWGGFSITYRSYVVSA